MVDLAAVIVILLQIGSTIMVGRPRFPKTTSCKQAIWRPFRPDQSAGAGQRRLGPSCSTRRYCHWSAWSL